MSEGTFKSADKSSLHIVMVTPFPKNADYIDGGVAGVARYLVDELKKYDIKISVIVPTLKKNEYEQEQWDGFTVCRIGPSFSSRCFPPILYELIFRHKQFKRLFSQIKPDLVHFQGATFRALGCRYPNVVTIHGIAERDALWESKKLSRYLKRFIYALIEGIGRRAIKNVILISQYVNDFLPKKSAQKKWLIENPISDSYFNLNRSYENGRIFVCGRVSYRKNTLGILKAFSITEKAFPFARLRIAGATDTDSDYFKLCQKFIDEHTWGKKVEFLGNISIGQVQQELTQSHCLLMPSFQETAPLSIEEAMAAGVPVIGSNVCGLPYMIQDGRTGFLINPYDSRSIAEAVIKILESKELANTMSNNAKEIARQRFRGSFISKKTFETYLNILSGSNIQY